MWNKEWLSLFIFVAVIFTIYIFEFLIFCRALVRKLFLKKKSSGLLTRPAIFVHILTLFGILCFLYGYYIEPNLYEVKALKISTPKLKKARIRIVHISDTHFESVNSLTAKLPEIINPLNPDVIVFTGDSLNRPEMLPEYQEIMSRLKAELGKFVCLGNFDVAYYNDVDIFEGTGFKVMDRDCVKLYKDNEPFYVSGMTLTYWKLNLDFLDGLNPDAYNVFLYHKTDIVDKVKDRGIDLYLSGHTHGGQVALPFYGAVLTFSKFGKKYEAGRYNLDDMVIYVNRGIGMEGGFAPRVRFFSKPEITVIDIVPEKKDI